MKKKILAFIILLCFSISAITIPAFADDKVIDITKPEGGSMVSDKAIVSICGISLFEDTFVEVYYYDSNDSEYKILPTVDGDSVVKVTKFYAKNYELKSKGDNSIKIKAYTTKTKDKPQENFYTISVSEPKKKNWAEEIKDGVINLVDFLKKL